MNDCNSDVAPGATPWFGGGLRALLVENIHSSARPVFAEAAIDVEGIDHAIDEDELIRRLDGVHLLGVRSKTRLTARVLREAGALIAVGCFCIGTSEVDLGTCTSLGIPVFNAPFANTRSVAEMVMAEIVVLSRRLFDLSSQAHAGRWSKTTGGAHEVRGKALGIVGYGSVGRQLGVLAEAFGMRVIFHDVVARLPMGGNRPVDSLTELLSKADVVSLHVPASPLTNRLIGTAELSAMRGGAYLINASRGTVVDIDALAASLASGHLAGAAVDVFPDEPSNNGNAFRSPLCGFANVLLTPHIGGSTREAQETIGRDVAACLTRYVTTGETTGAVNFPAVALPRTERTNRLLWVHRRVPGDGVQAERIASKVGSTLRAHVFATDANLGYLIMDVDGGVPGNVENAIAALAESIRTRLVM